MIGVCHFIVEIMQLKGEKVMDILQTRQQRNILFMHASNCHRETSRSSFVMTTITNNNNNNNNIFIIRTHMQWYKI